MASASPAVPNDEHLLGVSTEVLHFPEPYTTQSAVEFELTNRSPDKFIAYKVMSIDPERYVVNPTNGILVPSGIASGGGGGGGTPSSTSTGGATNATSDSSASSGSSSKVKLIFQPLANNAEALADFLRSRQKFLVKWRLLEAAPPAGVTGKHLMDPDRFPGSPIKDNIKLACSFDYPQSLSMHSAEGEGGVASSGEITGGIPNETLANGGGGQVTGVEEISADFHSSNEAVSGAGATENSTGPVVAVPPSDGLATQIGSKMTAIANSIGAFPNFDRPIVYNVAIIALLAIVIVLVLVK